MSEPSSHRPHQSQNQQPAGQQQTNQLQQQQQQFSAQPTTALQSQSSSSKPFGPADFFSHYQPVAGAPDSSVVYDEVFDDAGQLRPHWQNLDEGLSKMGAAGMDHRWKQIRRMVHQNGIAYSSYGDPAARSKHLQLDPLPQLIPAQEWNRIDAALKQRASLLNLMLADLYGPRKLLQAGVLPTDVLFNHPHYHIPYHGLPAPGGRHLHFYSAEISRSPTGDWWVMSDRTDSPGGCGFALENRIVVSRAFPNELRRCNVLRLAPYFIALREHVTSLAKRNKDNPHVAILSAGAGSSSFFEDSYFARYLGFTLVEANDLVVRSGQVMFKTLAGLTPIDVIIRRQQGNHLDPLELGGGAPGVAGILQVIRDQNVALVNMAGSGLVESPIFMAYMPRICQALTNTDLLLPGIATWWGGEAASLKIILDRIDEINLLPAFRHRTIVGAGKKHVHPDPETLSREERIELVRKNPRDWVGQEKVSRSSGPVWENGALRSGFISMRAFLCASEDSWTSLPGGLGRVSDSTDQLIKDPFRDGGAKDVWVLADKPVEPTSLLKTSEEALLPSRSNGFLSSRVADNLCWLGRYLERADAAARLLRAVIARLTGELDPADSRELPVLIRALAVEGQIDVGYAIKELSSQLPALDQCLAKNTLDRSDPNSLRSLVDRIVILASRVRERMSNDAWRIVQELSSNFESSQPQSCDLADLLEITNTLIVGLASFSGIVSESMTRTHAFRFLNIGRRMEHSLQIVGLLKHCFTKQELVTTELLEAVLEISDSGMTYRSRYYANLQPAAVLDLLIVDENNPRSLAFQLAKLNVNLGSLPDNSGHSHHSPERKLAMDTLHSIRMADIPMLSVANQQGVRHQLLELLEKMEKQLPAISTAISNRFLVHSGTVQQLIANPLPTR